MRSSSRIRLMAGVAAVLALCVAPAMAVPVGTEILLDFNNFDTAPGTSYGQWNTVASPGSGYSLALVDLSGTGTGITLNITDDFGGTTNTATNDGWTDVAVPWVDARALDDYFYVRDTGGGTDHNPTAQVVFAGLESDKTYTFDLIGNRNGAAPREADYYVNGLDSGNGNSQGYDAKTDGYDNHVVMTWTAVAPVYNAGSDTWQITLDVQKDLLAADGEFGYISAGRITVAEPVPEPATLGLLALGGLAIAGGAVRRRRQG